MGDSNPIYLINESDYADHSGSSSRQAKCYMRNAEFLITNVCIDKSSTVQMFKC